MATASGFILISPEQEVMDRTFVLHLFQIATFAGLLPSSIALLRISSPSRAHRLLRILVWGATLTGIAAHVLGRKFGINNLFLLHFYTVFEFVFLSLIFRPFIGHDFTKWVMILFAILATANSVFVENLNTFNVLARSVSAFVIMCYVMRYFFLTLKEMKIKYLERQPIFWISCGGLLYYAASFFIFIFSDDILPHEAIWFTYWGVHAIFTILLYLFYSIALWVQPEK